MTDRIPMTPQGLQRLEKELHHLKNVERPENVRDIELAREQGDLSENAEYQYAKEKQGHIAGRIQLLEDQIARADVIDTSKIGGPKARFGADVKLFDLETEEEISYKLVGPIEADVENGLISVQAPLGRAIIGKEEGDEVLVRTPEGQRELEVMDVSYEHLD